MIKTNMNKEKVALSIIFICYVISIIFHVKEAYVFSFLFKYLIAPFFTLLYIIFVKNKSILFLLFLILYAFSSFFFSAILIVIELGCCGNFLYDKLGIQAEYYITNTAVMIAYLLLFTRICSFISFKYVFKHLKLHFIILLSLSIYSLYIIQTIVKYEVLTSFEKYFLFSYHSIVLLLFVVGTLSYFYKDNKKALFLFIGVLFLLFSEVLDVAIIFMDDQIAVNKYTIVIGNLLTLIAFSFLYQQSKLSNALRENNILTN